MAYNKLTFGLQIPVYPSHQMQILQCSNDFCSIETTASFVEAFVGSQLQCAKEFTALIATR